MEPLGNILNQKESADPTLDSRIRRTVFWWSALALLYLGFGLELNTVDLENGVRGIQTPWGVPIKNFSEFEFLCVLFIFNAVFGIRLGWRIYISHKYNSYRQEAIEERSGIEEQQEEVVRKIKENEREEETLKLEVTIKSSGNHDPSKETYKLENLRKIRDELHEEKSALEQRINNITAEEIYERKSSPFKKIDKWFIGLGIPAAMCLVATIWLGIAIIQLACI